MSEAATSRKTGVPSDQQAKELVEAMSDLIRVYQFRDRDRTYCHGVSVSQCYALEAVARHGALTINQLAAHLYLSKSTVSRLVDGMERKGWIERRPHPQDRRACLISATKLGRRLHTRIVEDLEAREKELLAEFDPGVRRELIDFVRRLARTAEERARAVRRRGSSSADR